MIVIIALSACSKDPKLYSYNGAELNIAVVGVPPEITEEQVNFKEISLEELTELKLVDYDAVFILEEHLYQASKSQYADIYLKSKIPFFFISTTSHIPFTNKSVEYQKEWNWKPGEDFAVGILPKEGTLKGWKYGMYNDKKTDEHQKNVYSLIFRDINELNL